MFKRKFKVRKMDYDDQSFLMVTQKHWEDDIIWGVESTSKSTTRENNNGNFSKAISSDWGWVPTQSSLSQQIRNSATTSSCISTSDSHSTAVANLALANYTFTDDIRRQNGNSEYSNSELMFSNWEKLIIWDARDVNVSEERIPCYDIDDENVFLSFPSDVLPSSPMSKRVKPNNHSSNTKKVLCDSGLMKSEQDSDNGESENLMKIDPYNLSNDQYYYPEKHQKSFCAFPHPNITFHCKPVETFHPSLFPTSQFHFYGLKAYHRPTVRSLLFRSKYYTLSKVKNFANLMKKKRDRRQLEAEKKAEKASKVPVTPVLELETIEDLSGRVDEILLVEYCEQFPPLLSQVGMRSRITNYTRRHRNRPATDFKYGETDIVRENTFLGQLGEKETVQTLENNMYRCPIYEHPVGLDFLVIIAGRNLFIREIDGLFTAGQQSPLVVVHPPKSKTTTHYNKEFLKVEICRLLQRSKKEPKTIHTSSIKESFPNLPEHSIRKVLKDMAEYQRVQCENVWEIRSDDEFKLPAESELVKMFTPEQYCAHYSSASAELRLKLAGYRETNFLAKSKSNSGENNEDYDAEVMDEVKCAPWNTTRAFICASKGKCLLEIKGPADPTGCGEGFSYVRIPTKPFSATNGDKKKSIKGTKSDLRKLGIGEAKKILIDFGISQERIKKLSRWEIIDIVRTLSTEKEIEGNGLNGKEGLNFSRHNPNSTFHYQKKNKDDRQSVFELQNRMLSSSEVLSSDEDDDDNRSEFDMEEAAKFLEDVVVEDKTADQIDQDLEEKERKKLIDMMMADKSENSLNEKNGGVAKRRILKINRTYINPDGTSRTETEIIVNQDVIDIYVGIQKTGDNATQVLKKGILKKGAAKLQSTKKRLEMEKERRSKIRKSKSIIKKHQKPKYKLLPGFNKKCGACGRIGHLKTNSYCSKYKPKTAEQKSRRKNCKRSSSRKKKYT